VAAELLNKELHLAAGHPKSRPTKGKTGFPTSSCNRLPNTCKKKGRRREQVCRFMRIFAANQANPYAYDNKKAPFQPFTDAAHVAGSADRYVAQRQYRRHFLTDR
jgi:hypothetical protein